MEGNDIQEQTILFLARVMAINKASTDAQFEKFMEALDSDAHDVARMFLDEIRDFPKSDYSLSEYDGITCSKSAQG